MYAGGHSTTPESSASVRHTPDSVSAAWSDDHLLAHHDLALAACKDDLCPGLPALGHAEVAGLNVGHGLL